VRIERGERKKTLRVRKKRQSGGLENNDQGGGGIFEGGHILRAPVGQMPSLPGENQTGEKGSNKFHVQFGRE